MTYLQTVPSKNYIKRWEIHFVYIHTWTDKELKHGKIFNSHCGGCMFLLMVPVFQIWLKNCVSKFSKDGK